MAEAGANMYNSDRTFSTMKKRLLLFTPILLLPGCKDARQTSNDLPPELELGDLRPSMQPRIAPATNPTTLIRTSRAPIFQIFEGGGEIRVLDGGSKAELVRASLPNRRCIVAIDEANGITVAGNNLRPGPLPTGRSYEIWWRARSTDIN